MDDGLIRVTADRNKAESIIKMVDVTLKMIEGIDSMRFSSNVTKEYYDIIRELIGVILLLDGYKTYGEGAHKKLVEYLNGHYTEFSEYEVSLIDELRIIRNRIAYDGYFIPNDYLERKQADIKKIINKLHLTINKKLMNSV